MKEVRNLRGMKESSNEWSLFFVVRQGKVNTDCDNLRKYER